jgi:hypothetical protein
MVRVLVLMSLLLLAACGGDNNGFGRSTMSSPTQSHGSIDSVRIGAGDIADVATTAYGLTQGFAEANPLVSGAGSAVPVVGLVGKILIKKLLVLTGSSPAQANIIVETGSWVGGCANFVTVVGKAEPASAILVGLACGLVARDQLMRKAGLKH